MDQWQEPNRVADLDETIMRLRMRRPAKLRINTSPEIQAYLAQQQVASLPDPAPIILASARRRIVAEWAAEIQRDRLNRLRASIPPTRALGRSRGSGFRMLQAMVASGITASRDLTKPVRRDHVEHRRALAMWAIQARRGT